MSDLPEISTEELRARVLYSLVKAAGRLAHVFGMTLKDVRSWLEIAYFHELDEAGFTQREAAELFDVSPRKVAELARRLKENFFRPEQEGGLPRRIEYMLWAGSMSEGRIRQSLGDVDDAEIERALDQLVDEERVVRREGRTTRYEVPSDEFRLYKDDWIARIDGLNNHLSNIVDGIFARFFEDDDRAFARTVNFRCKPEHVEELRELYEEEIFPTLARMEKEVDRDDEEALEMGLSLNWAPHRYVEGVLEDDSSTDD